MKSAKTKLPAEDLHTSNHEHYQAQLKGTGDGASHGSDTGFATCHSPNIAARCMVRDLDYLVLRILARIESEVAQPAHDKVVKYVTLADPADHASQTSFHSADQPLGVLVTAEHNGGPHDQPTTTERPPSISHARRARRHRNRIFARQYRRPKERHEP